MTYDQATKEIAEEEENKEEEKPQFENESHRLEHDIENCEQRLKELNDRLEAQRKVNNVKVELHMLADKFCNSVLFNLIGYNINNREMVKKDQIKEYADERMYYIKENTDEE